MPFATISTFAAIGDSLPEWVRYVIVFSFVMVCTLALAIALFSSSHEHDRPEDVQQSDGEWMWPR